MRSNLRMLNAFNLMFEIQEQVKEEKTPEDENENFMKDFENKFLNQLKILCYKLFQNNKSKYLSITQMIDKTISENAMLPTGESLFKPVAAKALKKLEKNIVELKSLAEYTGNQSAPIVINPQTTVRRIEGNTFERKKSPTLSGYNRRQASTNPLEKPVKVVNMRKALNQSFHGTQPDRKTSSISNDALVSKNQSFVSHITTVDQTGSGSKVHRKISMGVDEYNLRTSNYSRIVVNDDRYPKESKTDTLRGSEYTRIRVSSTGRAPVKIVGDNSSSSKNNGLTQVTHRRVVTVDNVKDDSPAQSIMTIQTKFTINPEDLGPAKMHKTYSPASSTKAVRSPDNFQQATRIRVEGKDTTKENDYRSVPVKEPKLEWKKQVPKKTEPLAIVRNENQPVQEDEELLGKALCFSITGADNENPELRQVSVTDCDTPQRNSIKSAKGEFRTPGVNVKFY